MLTIDNPCSLALSLMAWVADSPYVAQPLRFHQISDRRLREAVQRYVTAALARGPYDPPLDPGMTVFEWRRRKQYPKGFLRRRTVFVSDAPPCEICEREPYMSALGFVVVADWWLCPYCFQVFERKLDMPVPRESQLERDDIIGIMQLGSQAWLTRAIRPRTR